MSAPSPGEAPRRRRTSVTIAAGALLLLLPLLALFLLSRSGLRRITRTPAPATAKSAPPAAEQGPRILESPDSAVQPFGSLKEPRDAALDDRGRLWIADFGNSMLRIYDADGGYLGGWGGKGESRHSFRDLAALAVAGEDVYVADTWNGRVEKFGLDGAWKGEAPGLFGPRGIAVGPGGNVWVSDTGNHRVARYDSALLSLGVVGKQGSGPGEFSSPVGIAVAPDGTVYVADTGNRRIVRLDPSGKFRSAWQVPGWERAVEPHLEIDDDGSVWATDPASAEALLHFDRTGRVTDRRSTDDQGRRFSLPTGLALDRKNRVLYVVGSGNNVVSKLRVPRDAGRRP